MQTLHNPDRYASDLRQLLSQGRKRIGLLVGAGAPMSIRVSAEGKLDSTGTSLLPGVEELTRRAVDGLSGPYAAAAACIKDELGAGANIETVLTRIRLLEQAIGTSLVNGLDAAGYRTLGADICARIGQIVGAGLPAGRSAYSELVSWVSGTVRTHPIEIFTTNYDLLFEEAFESARASYFDGFTGGSAPFFDPVTVSSDDLPARWSRLWKLHGSLGWALEAGRVVRGRGRQAAELLYPDHLKYELTQKQPYAALFERLKQFLLCPDTILLATGFSFRDAHICAVLDEALAINANAAAVAFQFQGLDKEEAACRLAFDRPNLSVYAADGAVIGGVRGTWQPGELPKNWGQIRATFCGPRGAEGTPSFLLGDFATFTRFCALAQSTDLSVPTPSLSSPQHDPLAVAPNGN